MFRIIQCLSFTALLLFIISAVNAQNVSIVAGNGNPGFSGDGGPALQAAIQNPNDVAVDNNGNLYICASNRLRKVSTAGIITSIAGNGNVGFSGDGGPAILADYKGINCAATDINGNIYVSDSHRIRKINSAGIVNTIAGTGVGGFSGDGGPATAAQINYPDKIVVDAAGNIYFSDALNHRVRRINNSGIINTIAGTGTAGFSGDGGPATAAQLNTPYGLAMDGAGYLYVADYNNQRIRKISPSGIIATVAGSSNIGNYENGIPANNASLLNPASVAIDAPGNIYISSLDNTVRAVTTGSYIYTLATFPGSGNLGIATDASNNVYVAGNNSNTVKKISYCAGPPVISSFSITGDNVVCPFTTHTYSIPTTWEPMYYTWTLPNVWTGIITMQNSVQATSGFLGGTVSVTATNICGTSAPLTLPVTIDNVMPVATVTATDTVLCQQSIPVLIAGAGPGYQYQWYYGNMSPLFGETNDSFYASSPGQFILVVSNAGGCNHDTSNVITITDLPAPGISPWSPDTMLCAGETLTLTANSTWGTSYQWQVNQVDIPGATSASYVAMQTGTYSVEVTGYSTCEMEVGMNVNVSPPILPDITNYAGDTALLCPGSILTLYTNVYPDQVLQWQMNGVDVPGAVNWSYIVYDTGFYTLVATNYVTGCDSSASIHVVFGSPIATITTSGILPICTGDSILLETPYDPAFTYLWYVNGSPLALTDTSKHKASFAGLYEVKVTHGGCDSLSPPFAVTIVAPPAPIIIQSGQQLSVPAIYTSYQWYLNGNPIPGATSDTYTPTQSGDYHVVVYDGGCDGPSNTVTITLSVDGLSKNTTPISLYPNPNNGIFTIELPQPGNTDIVITDVAGKVIVKQNIRAHTQHQLQFNLANEAKGVYFIKVVNEGEVYQSKIIIP